MEDILQLMREGGIRLERFEGGRDWNRFLARNDKLDNCRHFFLRVLSNAVSIAAFIAVLEARRFSTCFGSCFYRSFSVNLDGRFFFFMTLFMTDYGIPLGIRHVFTHACTASKLQCWSTKRCINRSQIQYVLRKKI